MRIVAGKYGGRRLEVPGGRDIRPTSDKVRGAVFNALESMGAVRGCSIVFAEQGRWGWRRFLGGQSFAALWIKTSALWR